MNGFASRFHGNDLVYFMYAPQLAAVKIGLSKDPDERMRSLQTALPVDLVLLHWVPGSYAKEKKFHRMFLHLHMRGEWFRAEPELMGFIGNLRAKRACRLHGSSRTVVAPDESEERR